MKTYHEIAQELQQDLIKIRKQKNNISNFRLLCFLVTAILVYQFYKTETYLFLGVALLSFLGFVVLIVKSSSIIERFDYTKQALEILDAIKADDLQDNYESDNDKFDNVYNKDLDILVGKSLFNRLNKTQTRIGNLQLKSFLSNLLLHKAEIIKRQEAFAELRLKREWITRFLTLAKRLNINEESIFVYENRVFNNQNIRFIPMVYAAINLVIFIALATIGFPQKWVVIWILSAVILSTIVGFIFKNQLAKVGAYTNMKASELEHLYEVFHHIETESFEAELSRSVQNSLAENQQKASTLIKTISSAKETLDAANFPMVGFILNTFFLWRLYYSIGFENEIQKTVHKIQPWLNEFSQLEAFVSFAIFNDKFDNFTKPEISEEVYQLELSNAFHPLLSEEIAVKNSFSSNRSNNIAIITGANMAGKSTFLRTIGTNLVLGMNGANVSAESMRFYPMDLFTSIRTVDNLSSGDSYFKNEINKLKVLIERLENQQPQYIILDEILKGTNSQDKLVGSHKFLEKLMNSSTQLVGFIATHDLELTKMEEEFPNHIINYCFELKNVNDQYVSDYKLRKGTTQMMNAIFLMKQFRIID